MGAIIIEVVGLGATSDASNTFTFKLHSPSDLPVVLGLYPTDPAEGDIDVRATAWLDGRLRVDKRMPARFVPGQVDRLTMDLSSPCHDRTCPSDQLCDDQSGTCADADGGAPLPDGGP